MSSSRPKIVSAFDYKGSVEVKEKPAFRHPPGIVTRTEISSVPKLRAAFALAGEEPLKIVDGRGRVICKVFSARADIPAFAHTRHLSNMVTNLDHFVNVMGPMGVTEIVTKGPDFAQLGDKSVIRVAYFTGKNFELTKT